MARITRVETFVYRAPIATTIKTSSPTMPDPATVLVRIEDSDGAFGWGEVWGDSPCLGAEYRACLLDTVLADRLLGCDSNASPSVFWADADRALHIQCLRTGEPGAFAAALAGLDIAMNDLAARRADVPLWKYLGGNDGSPVRVYASGIHAGSCSLELVRDARRKGFRAFKIKIGCGDGQDVATLERVAEKLATDEWLMADADQAWDITSACRIAGLLSELPLSWIEEALAADRPSWEWAQVKAASDAPLAAGENLRGVLTFQKLIADGYLSVFQPNMCKWGGFSGTLAVGRAIIAADRAFCPHHSAGGVGLIASLHLLATVRGPGLVKVDINPNPLREELLSDVLCIRDGSAELPAAPGLGFTPNLAAFREFGTQHTESKT
ncbi:MAG TPA: mandelate racemase/muconate lactonizing enzyme family protein [Terriglobales bacterium]